MDERSKHCWGEQRAQINVGSKHCWLLSASTAWGGLLLAGYRQRALPAMHSTHCLKWAFAGRVQAASTVDRYLRPAVLAAYIQHAVQFWSVAWPPERRCCWPTSNNNGQWHNIDDWADYWDQWVLHTSPFQEVLSLTLPPSLVQTPAGPAAAGWVTADGEGLPVRLKVIHRRLQMFCRHHRLGVKERARPWILHLPIQRNLHCHSWLAQSVVQLLLLLLLPAPAGATHCCQ